MAHFKYLWVSCEFAILDVLPKNLDIFICVFLVPEQHFLGNDNRLLRQCGIGGCQEFLETGKAWKVLSDKLHGVKVLPCQKMLDRLLH